MLLFIKELIKLICCNVVMFASFELKLHNHLLKSKIELGQLWNCGLENLHLSV